MAQSEAGGQRLGAYRAASGRLRASGRGGAAPLGSDLHQEGFGPPTCCSSKVAKRCGQPATKGDVKGKYLVRIALALTNFYTSFTYDENFLDAN